MEDKPQRKEKDMKEKNLIWLAALLLLLSSGCATTKGGEEVSGVPVYTITGSGGKTTGPLRITRIELNFQNDRGEIAVPINGEILPYAVIRFDGNGLFRAAWMVDGRPLEEVAINVTFGDTITLRTSPGTVFPAFEPGQHTVTLKINEPAPPFDIPVIRYFVTGERKDISR